MYVSKKPQKMMLLIKIYAAAYVSLKVNRGPARATQRKGAVRTAVGVESGSDAEGAITGDSLEVGGRRRGWGLGG